MRLRGHSGVPATVLAFVLSAGILLPEVGHALAHLSAEVEHGHTSHHDRDHHRNPFEANTLIEEGGQAGHPHLDLLATVPSSSSLKSLVAATPSVQDLLLESIPARRVYTFSPETAPPFVSEHGPPPPSRAPPVT